MLRDYQKRSLRELYSWFEAGNTGHPCLVLPTGSGKSHIVAALCKEAVINWPETRILMLTHVKELIEQNAFRMLQHWPGAPLGIFSASIGKKQIDQITFAGIQSVRKRASELGHVDLVIIDEAHLVSHRQEGSYRSLIKDLLEINTALRVIGLTATPYRLGHGLITDEPALFSDLIEPVRIEELIHKGFLAPLRSKLTEEKLDLEGVKKRGGEFIESDLQKKALESDHEAISEEIIQRAGDRKHWLIFCAGVAHAQEMAKAFESKGIQAAAITGAHSKEEREDLLSRFRIGEIQALTNANLLTTGFDFPGIDLIAFLRATASPGLYVQMAGRGMRIKDHTDHCLVLDFAGNVSRHGPIVAVEPPRKKGNEHEKAGGEPPTKDCPECSEICSIQSKICPSCGFEFPPSEKKKLKLENVDIMGGPGEEREMRLSSWRWRKHTSRSSGKEMLAVSYYGENLSDQVVVEYFPVTHEGYPGEKARKAIVSFLGASAYAAESGLAQTADALNAGPHPKLIRFQKEGKFYRVTSRSFT